MSLLPPREVRLKVSYRSAESLLAEYTRSLGKGSVTLESRKQVPLGTRFVFELHSGGVAKPLEVLGEVIRVTPTEQGKHLLHIQYNASTAPAELDSLIQRIFDAHRFEKIRKHPRIPLNLRASEDIPYSPSYVIRDLSLGGLGAEVEADRLPEAAKVGTPFVCEVWLTIGSLVLLGEVAWTFTPPSERARILNPSFGVKFGTLRPDTKERLEQILRLKSLPPPPWRARVSYGLKGS